MSKTKAPLSSKRMYLFVLSFFLFDLNRKKSHIRNRIKSFISILADVSFALRSEALIGRKFDPYDDRLYELVDKTLDEMN
jgi:hypothetical protein